MPGHESASIPSINSSCESCGVSMPTSSAGPSMSSNAAASRSPRPSPRCLISSKPGTRQRSALPVEHEDLASCRRSSDDLERVEQRRFGESRRLGGRAWRAQTRLHAPGDRCLGDHDEGGSSHAALRKRCGDELLDAARKVLASLKAELDGGALGAGEDVPDITEAEVAGRYRPRGRRSRGIGHGAGEFAD